MGGRASLTLRATGLRYHTLPPCLRLQEFVSLFYGLCTPDTCQQCVQLSQGLHNIVMLTGEWQQEARARIVPGVYLPRKHRVFNNDQHRAPLPHLRLTNVTIIRTHLPCTAAVGDNAASQPIAAV